MITLIAPDVGMVVGCWFPEDAKDPSKKGDKFRPALVLNVAKRIDKDEIYLTLAFGTGQSEIANKGLTPAWCIEKSEGLKEMTRFNIKNVASIPLINKYFKNPKDITSFSIFASLNQKEISKVVSIIERFNINLNPSVSSKTCIIEKRRIGLIK